MAFRLFVFDLDGTLIDSLQDITNAVNHARAYFGLQPLQTTDVRPAVGDGIRVLIERAIPELHGDDIDKGVAQARDFYQRHPVVGTRLYPGAAEAFGILALKKKFVLTNKPEDIARAILAELVTDAGFEGVWGGDRPEGRKPSPAPLLAILRQTGVRADETVMIGDGVNDIAAAQGAGISSLAIGYGYTDPGQLRSLGPTWLAASPDELLLLLRKMIG